MNQSYYETNAVSQSLEPVRIAIIGAGNRTQTLYRWIFSALQPWITVVAVCDPIKAHADRLANDLNVPAFYHVRDLVQARPMEAVFILTPIESHYAYSIYCAENGIHHLVETMLCSLLGQAKRMVETAQSHNVVMRMAENFFCFPVDRFAKAVKNSGSIGKIGRIVSYTDFTGYHNNSRWLWFAGAHPTWVQGIRHTIATPPHRSFAHRLHHNETFTARFYSFPDGLLVSDQAANIKGLLGRHPRPGYTEWQGDQGTLVYQAKWPNAKQCFNELYPFANLETRLDTMLGQLELRRCHYTPTSPDSEMSGIADEYVPVDCEYQHAIWSKIAAQTQDGVIEYTNTMFPDTPPAGEELPADAASVMEVIAAFALAVRGINAGEFNAEDACMSLMMEVAMRESALNDGKRVTLPLDRDVEADAQEIARIRKVLNVDPYDVGAMLDITYARP